MRGKHWDRSADYQRFWRYITGKTQNVSVPMDVIIKACAESPTLRESLDKGTSRAVAYLTESGGEYAHQRGSGHRFYGVNFSGDDE